MAEQELLPEFSEPLPEGWVALEQIAVLKCIDDEGSSSLCVRLSDGLTVWEALGMLEVGSDMQRKRIADAWEDG